MELNDQQNKTMIAAGLNLIAQALSIYDSDLRLVLCNEPFRRMFNLPANLTEPGSQFEATIRHLAVSGEYGAVEDVDAFVQLRVDQARAFKPHYMERTRSNGRTISVEGFPLPQGGWITVYTDITRTKRSEELLRARSEVLSDQLLAHAEELSAANRELAAANTALEETKRQLTEIESRTRLTTEMMPAHIAHVNPKGHYTYSNRRLSSVIPGCRSNVIGGHISDVLGSNNYDRIKPYLEEAYAGESPVFEFTESQDSRRIRVALTPDRSGGTYILSMDVTEETQARSALQQSRRRAIAAQLTNGLAHDFSNLLTIILGLQGKLDKMDLDGEAGELVAATQTAARRGGRLLNRIAEMTGSRTLRPKATDMQTFLDDIGILATPSLPHTTGLSILNHTSDALVMLDAGMLQDALLNLILNARDACGTSGQITVSAHVVGRTWLEISVNDTGPGFSEEALEKAFNPFFTTKGGEGSGLGLSMVYDMVKLAGGSLTLTNVASGACVTLRLPYREAPPVSGGLALLVEDSETLRALFRDMLMELGYSVIEATSADEASALAAEIPDIALVLSDIQLQGEGTGIDLIDRVQGKGLPCILMTSLPTDDPLYHRALARGPVLRKPFNSDQVAALLRAEAAE